MPKPTLWQSILGKPSQAYSFPQENIYFSNKQDMLRIAAEVEQQRLRQQIQSIEALQQVTILFAFSSSIISCENLLSGYLSFAVTVWCTQPRASSNKN